ncbi:hypothetical protein BB560_003212 [Smittium megazygosporum]|uniref:tRNA (adenine(58)-N(1))-methyltransferase catalytic subunit TRM61 n=1 Tax=Smittium megazygosporum TaxID=133381 RepID=A0A2T9ZCR9_9FUNG|nr:hypothetical protein BB560_003212 [Smittium megazygosporum]
MSKFHEYKKFIQEGDRVLVYMNRDSIVPIIVNQDECLKIKFGEYPHTKMIGLEYGSQIESSKGKGYVYLLHPTPELWTIAVPHRTQILYTPDISFISLKLNLRPGSVVIESGTGSGAFSHAIARTISNSGFLHTFEYHKHRADFAIKELEAHNLKDIVNVVHRDVCKDGFGLEGVADADLPAPWEAIPSASKAFKKSIAGRICTFSPCIEQVQRTADALNMNNFFDIETIECLARDYTSLNQTMPDIQTIINGDKVKFKFVKGKKRMLLQDGEDNAHSSILVSSPSLQTKGHTSYLTFATYYNP